MALLIAEFPDGLRVQGVSNPPSHIPHWNEYSDNISKVTMRFPYAYLHDDGAFQLFYPNSPIVRREVASYLKNYKMRIVDEWTIVNYLHLANSVYASKNVSNFHSHLYMFFVFFLLLYSFAA